MPEKVFDITALVEAQSNLREQIARAQEHRQQLLIAETNVAAATASGNDSIQRLFAERESLHAHNESLQRENEELRV